MLKPETSSRVIAYLDECRSIKDAASWSISPMVNGLTHTWSQLADLVLIAHVAVALFVVLGQIIIFVGGIVGLKWIRNLRFRIAHLSVITLIAAETWIGAECPLTQLERALRVHSGQTVYEETFTEHWISSVLFFPAPPWFFILLHSVAALIVFGSLILFPPQALSIGARHKTVEKR